MGIIYSVGNPGDLRKRMECNICGQRLPLAQPLDEQYIRDAMKFVYDHTECESQHEKTVETQLAQDALLYGSAHYHMVDGVKVRIDPTLVRLIRPGHKKSP